MFSYIPAVCFEELSSASWAVDNSSRQELLPWYLDCIEFFVILSVTISAMLLP